jgi:type II secretory pathway pseudopilin PulG
VANRNHMEKQRAVKRQAGFTMLELLASMFIMVVAGGIVVGSLIGMTKAQGTISNRTEMHSSIRSATELLEQEIGQAGGIALPGNATLAAAIAAAGSQAVTISSTASGNSTSGIFVNEQLSIDTGANQETVTVTAVTSSQITASFTLAHSTGVSVAPLGGFSGGIVPPSVTNGSTGSVLKIFGNINGDGNMVYVEYTCDTTGGNLYRNSMPYDAAHSAKPALSSGLVLLPNILANPGNAACFTYQTKTVGGTDYIVDVAVTLTAQTQAVDPQTGFFQQETKALLNVSPRNVFEVWNSASLGLSNRIQPVPASVTSLLP